MIAIPPQDEHDFIPAAEPTHTNAHYASLVLFNEPTLTILTDLTGCFLVQSSSSNCNILVSSL